ncbi:MAG: replicative DNA helicase [Sulfurimonas sp. RIFOXYD12_FULL_33_39]|uniref:replicative DNA helicase n=1 Tax=unclassified Sulfurimonas TaxID=2623549 RepID=UPI0008B9C3E8|nr:MULTISPECIES: replicative DNA helicase [unclassified Sulfurimonas]OHE10444.1 MAG: replicative DNA helicase [Sulfurimonas sp. RIFOXYD12_FULL_33_39]OHE14903.1 MAG: replicative DNA helicase [Sulfurimonas sp. RIFOXYD2_FULL_34_21]DAB27403.1 MAG TPA: replicative DNA helicase [Sulfurimonas sp. UBA10385]
MQENLYNLAFERSILSSIVFEPSQFDELGTQLRKDDFYLPAHQDIFSVMTLLLQKDQPIDEEFIKKELIKMKKFDESVMLEILSANPISNTKAYVDEIRDKSLKRNLLTLTTEIKRVTVEEELPSAEVIDIVEKKLYEITQDNQTSDFKNSPKMTFDTMEYIKEMKARGNSVLVGVDTGFHELNKMTTGFGKGDLVIVAARPAMGKTSFILNTVNNLITKGKGVAFFSLEMPAEQLMLRLLSIQTSIPLQKLRVGDMNDDQWSSLNGAIDRMNNAKLFVDDAGSININQLRSKLRKLKNQHPEIEIAVIDYLQIMSGVGTQDRHLQVSEMSRGLKMLARELNMPIVALSQLNRGLESRNDKRPMLSDIRESGSIEQDADIILFVYRDDVYLYKEEKEREKAAKAEGKEFNPTYIEKEEEDAEIIIGKQRNGPTGHVKLIFQKKLTRFVDATPYAKGIETIYENVDTRSANIDISNDMVSMPPL